MTSGNRQLLVKQWPKGLPALEDFELVDGPMPVPGDAQVLIRNKYLSIDPYYRHSLGPRFLGAAVSGRAVRVLSTEFFGDGALPLSTALGVAGNPGLTAYAGLMMQAKARPGETFVVSSASGSVGATAGQLARSMGLSALGIAGAAEKCAWVVETAGFVTVREYLP